MTNKLLSYSSLGTLVLVLALVAMHMFGGSSSFVGGMTNYNSLTLQPETSSDNALVVKNAAGTTQLTVYGAGGILITGTSTISGTVAISGALTQSGAFTATGDSRILSPVWTGASSTLTAAATTSISAAVACDGGLVNFDPQALTVGTTTLPTATSTIADCLTTDGDEVTLLFRNLSSATTTQFIFGDRTTSTIIIGEAATDDIVAASGWATLRFVRVDATSMAVYLNTFVNAD